MELDYSFSDLEKKVQKNYKIYEEIYVLDYLQKSEPHLRNLILEEKYSLKIINQYYSIHKKLNYNQLKSVIELGIKPEIVLEILQNNYILLDKIINNKLPHEYILNILYNEKIKKLVRKLPISEQICLSYRFGLSFNAKEIIKKCDKIIFEIDNGHFPYDLVCESKYIGINLKDQIEKNKNKISTLNPQTKKENERLIKLISKRKIYFDQVKKIHIDLMNEIIEKCKIEFDGTEHTLQGVANMFGISRERVRQIENKAVEKITHLLNFDVEGESYLGLDSLSCKINNINIEINKEFNNPAFLHNKYLREKYIGENMHYYYNKLVFPRNSELINTFMEKKIIVGTHVKEIETQYIQSLKDHGIYEIQELIDPIDNREIEGLLERNLNVVKSINHKYRYFRGNKNKIIARVNDLLSVVPDYFSTKLIFDKYDDWDIDDHYELHNFLKKNYVNKLNYHRTPHISKTGISLEEYIYENFKDKFTLDDVELGEIISEKTGINQDTIVINYIPKIKEKYLNLVLSQDIKNEITKFCQTLTNDIYRKNEFESIKNYDIIMIALSVSSKYKYKVSHNWLLKRPYENLLGYVRLNLEGNIFDEQKLVHYKKEQNYMAAKSTWRLKRNFFRFSMDKLISIEKLNIKEKLRKLDEKILNEWKFPQSIKVIIDSKKFANQIIECKLEEYLYYPDIFWYDYLASIHELNVSTDKKIISLASSENKYVKIMSNLKKIKITDFEDKYFENYQVQISANYLDSIKNIGMVVKGIYIYKNKMEYFKELEKMYDK